MDNCPGCGGVDGRHLCVCQYHADNGGTTPATPTAADLWGEAADRHDATAEWALKHERSGDDDMSIVFEAHFCAAAECRARAAECRERGSR